MLLGNFSHDEPLEWNPSLPAASNNRTGNRVSPNRHSPDELGRIGGNDLQHPRCDLVGSLAVESQLSTIKIKLGLFSRSQSKITELQSVFFDQLDQPLTVIGYRGCRHVHRSKFPLSKSKK